MVLRAVAATWVPPNTDGAVLVSDGFSSTIVAGGEYLGVEFPRILRKNGQMPALVIFIIAALVLRVATYGSTIPNIAPIAAIALCGGLFLAKKNHALWLTFGALLGADIIISF